MTDVPPNFSNLLKGYDRVETRKAELKGELDVLDLQRTSLRQLLSQEVQNMGLGRGTKLDVPGTGSFHFTTQRGFSLPAEYREEFVKILISRGETSLLTIGRADLKAWCDDMLARGEAIPSYIKKFEDRFVPAISLESTKTRRAAKQAEKLPHNAQGANDE